MTKFVKSAKACDQVGQKVFKMLEIWMRLDSFPVRIVVNRVEQVLADCRQNRV